MLNPPLFLWRNQNEKQNKTKQAWNFRFVVVFTVLLYLIISRVHLNGYKWWMDKRTSLLNREKASVSIATLNFVGKCRGNRQTANDSSSFENYVDVFAFFFLFAFIYWRFLCVLWENTAARKRDSESIVRQYPDKVPVRF